jgi:FkbM family methyltransferase
MKAIARKLIPMWIYRKLSRVYSYLLAWREGPICIAKMAFGSGEMTHRFRTLVHPFSFQINEENRKVVLGNLIKKEVMDGPLPKDARFIVDAGGYIGDSAALFLSRYPHAQCLVLEPGMAHAWASRNLAAYGPRAILLKAALMQSAGAFRIVEADTGTHVVADIAGTVEVVTIPQLLSRSPHGRIDILKIDIEGAEVDLFKGGCDWLSSVDCLSIELHGDEAKREIPLTLLAAGFELSRHGSLTVAVRKLSRDKS